MAQSLPTKRLVSLDKEQKAFVEGKTLVSQVLFSGLDIERYDDSDYVLLDPIYESDVRLALKHDRNAIRPGEKFDLQRVGSSIGVVKERLFQIGYFNAKVVALGKELSRDEMAIILSIERGPKSGVSGIRFQGSKTFTEEELRTVLMVCLGSAWGKYNLSHIDYCAQKGVRGYMQDRGYFQSKVSAPSRKFGEETVEIRFEVNEGTRYRVGDLSIKGNKVFSEREIWAMLNLSRGDIANGRAIKDFAFEKLPETYREKGYVNFVAEFEPTYIPPVAKGLDGFVNIDFVVDEGPEFKFGSITFLGVKDEVASELKSDFPLRSEDVYSQKVVDGYIKKLNDSGRFKPIDPYRDVEVLTSVDEPPKASSDAEPVLRSPRSERKNDIELRVKLILNKD